MSLYLCAIVFITACTDGEPPLPGSGPGASPVNITIPALTPPAGTRADALPPGMKTAWHAGDRVYMRIQFHNAAGSLMETQLAIAEYDATATWVFDSVITPPAGADNVTISASYAGADVLESITGAVSDAFGAITLNPFTHVTTLVYFTGLSRGDVIELGNKSFWYTRTIDPEKYQLTYDNNRLTSYTVTNTDGTAEIYALISTAGGTAYFRVIPAGGTQSDDNPWVAIEGVSRDGGDWYTIDCRPLLAEGGGVDIDNLDRELFLAWAERVRAAKDVVPAPPALYEDFTLTGHIDLTGLPNWEPIPIYYGTFDGAGYTITGLTVDVDNGNAGLFNSLREGGAVKNLHLRGANIKGGGERTVTGGIAGSNYGTITGCTVQGTLEGTNVGAIAGQNTGIISACAGLDTYLTCTLRSGGAGGLVANNNKTIVGCYSTAKEINVVGVTGTNQKGGIVFVRGVNSVVTDCFWLPVNNVKADDNCPNFTSVADFYAQGFIMSMNNALTGGDNDTPYRWRDRSITNEYPTINNMKP